MISCTVGFLVHSLEQSAAVRRHRLTRRRAHPIGCHSNLLTARLMHGFKAFVLNVLLLVPAMTGASASPSSPPMSPVSPFSATFPPPLSPPSSPPLGSRYQDLISAVTAQSSTAMNGISSRAVNPYPSNLWSGGTCTHTNWEPNPWWSVQLPALTAIQHVRILNREDCCWTRLDNFHIEVDGVECASGGVIGRGAAGIVPCAALGTEVKITLPGNHKVLTLCDVAVYGTSAFSPPPNPPPQPPSPPPDPPGSPPMPPAAPPLPFMIVSPDETNRAYSSVQYNSAPGQGSARSSLDSARSWVADVTDEHQWMVLDLGRPETVYAVVTQPRYGSPERVLSFGVDFCPQDKLEGPFDCEEWAAVDDGVSSAPCSFLLEALPPGCALRPAPCALRPAPCALRPAPRLAHTTQAHSAGSAHNPPAAPSPSPAHGL